MKSSGFCISLTAALPSKLASTISPKQNVRVTQNTHNHPPSAGGCELKKSDHTILKILNSNKELGGGKRKIKVEIKKKNLISFSPSPSHLLFPSLLPFLFLRNYNTKHYMVIGMFLLPFLISDILIA